MKLVILGFGPAGFAAMLSAKKQNRDAKIAVIDKKDYLQHSCGFPFYIQDKISLENLKHKVNLESMGFKSYFNHEVVKIIKDENKLLIKNINTNEENILDYDSLIIATGASSFIPPIPGAKELLNKGVFTVDCATNAQLLKDFSKPGSKAFVIGAGAIGLETAVALKKKGLDVTIVEMLPYCFPKSIDADISKILEDYMISLGIKFMFNSKLEKINIENNSIKSVVINGNELPCNLVVMAAGVKANTELAKNAGIEIGKWGILVNKNLQTSQKDIFAAGDCIQTISLINEQPWMAQLATTAYKQGTIVGINACGGNNEYLGSLTTFVSKIGELEIASTGFNENSAKDFGYDYLIGKATGETKPEWFIGGKKITVKILVDKKTQKILGAQAIGEEGAASRINLVSAAIKAKFTVYDLSDVELSYCPEVSDTYDILTKAADFTIRTLEK